MARLLYVLMLIPVIAVTALGCSGNQADFSVKPGEMVTLAIGQSAQITGEDLEITFAEVVGDSRCPQNVTCIWEGVASSLIRITYKGVSYSIVLDEPGLTEQAQDSFFDYTLTFNLQPYPVAGVEISAEDYRLNLTVSR